MHNLYLFRHGQAGPRNNYDTLSPLGIEQARCLGEYLAREGVHFESAWAGGLERQRQTAREVEQAYQRLGVPFPEIVVDERWSEFYLYGVYQSIAPQMCSVDKEFQRNYQQMLEDLKDPESDVHRRWHACDEAVLEAWLEGRFEIDVETFAQFRTRVEEGFAARCSAGAGGNVAVFTSATPIGLSVARSVGLPGTKLMRLVESLHNASSTVLRVRDEEPYLFSFNNITHLSEGRLRTFR
ncbi:MAG: histidine phosphatase family protein [Acidobacteria bacterium]|nr:histidine phosphatase family protein [Acidobacteriota bacterium]